MKTTILGIRITLALVLGAVAAAPVGPALAFNDVPEPPSFSPDNALSAPGTVWAWGSKGATGLGNGGASDSKVPVQVSGLSGIVKVAAGDWHALALKSDGTVWAWGLNSAGQLGDATTINRVTPVQVSGLSGVVDIAAGSDHSLAVKSDGTVWSWGYNLLFKFGSDPGWQQYWTIPHQVNQYTAEIKGVTAVAAGGRNSLALMSDGTVFAWATGSYFPGKWGGLSNVTRISVAKTSSTVVTLGLALKSDGTAWFPQTTVWGATVFGNSPGGTNHYGAATQVSGLNGIVDIAGGDYHLLAVKSDGTVWAWGANYYGQLGDTTSINTGVPVQVSGLTGVVAIAAGKDHSLAVKTDGTVWSWGYNYYGQLGDNSTVNRNIPVQVSGLTGVSAVSASNYYSLAIRTVDVELKPVTGIAPVTPAPAPALTPTPTTPAPAPAPAPAAPTTTPVAPVAPTPIAKTAPRSGTSYISPETRGLSPMMFVALSVWVVSGTQVISSADLALNFDTQGLEVLEVKPGAVFGTSPAVIKNDYNNTGGTVRLVAARGSGASPSTGPAALAVILFRMKMGTVQGDYAVSVSKISLADAQGQDIPVTQMKGSIISMGGQKMGDIDGNGVIDYKDLGIFGGAYGTSQGQSGFNDKADLNDDGVVNYIDLAIFGANYGK